MINEKTADLIHKTLKNLSDKIYNESGCKIMIGFAIENEDEIIEGAVSSGYINYGLACKMLIGINSFVSDYYGNLDLDDIIDMEGNINPLT